MHRVRHIQVLPRIRAAIVRVYKLSKLFPSEERYGLTSQVRRAAVSVGTNLVEGLKRKTDSDTAYRINISEGSAGEVWFILDLVPDLEFQVPNEDVRVLAQEFEEIERILASLRMRFENTDSV